MQNKNNTNTNGKEQGRQDAKPKKNILQRIRKSPTLMGVIALVVLVGAVYGLQYWQTQQSQIYIEKSSISAPIISLSPPVSPMVTVILDKLYVKEGDKVTKNEVLASLSDGSVIRAGTDGIVISVMNAPGQVVASSTPVVQVIDPKELRVVGQVEEDKGLKDIKVGQKVVFTVDAFGSKEYQGVVDSISPTARSSDIVFSISDNREEQMFDVKVKYDIYAYPELMNGMSAKMWIHK